MHTPKLLATAAFAAVLALAGPAAMADTFYNDLEDPITIDTDFEVMNLTYDSVNAVGTSGSATIALQVNGQPFDDVDDHAGCNIQGGAHFVSLAASSSNDAVATVALSNDGTFDACADTVTATVTSHGVGSANITFVVDDQDTANDPALNFRVDQARFTVNVTEGSGGGGNTGCDANPAAPAWANAILQKSGVKAKAATNYVSIIAQGMGQGATFQGIVKNADQDAYANAVRNRLIQLTGNANLASVASSARPGWTCVVLTS